MKRFGVVLNSNGRGTVKLPDYLIDNTPPNLILDSLGQSSRFGQFNAIRMGRGQPAVGRILQNTISTYDKQRLARKHFFILFAYSSYLSHMSSLPVLLSGKIARQL